MKNLNFIASLLLIVGGLNWGLVALADINLVTLLCGADTALAKGVYAAVGLSAVFQLVQLFSCSSKSNSSCCR
jgi:uncharacterized membrane protein YuzA (DUF378 family)